MKLKEAVEYLLESPENKVTKKQWNDDEYLKINDSGAFVTGYGEEYCFGNANDFTEDCWKPYLNLNIGDIIKVKVTEDSYNYFFLVLDNTGVEDKTYLLYGTDGKTKWASKSLDDIKDYLLKYYKVASSMSSAGYLNGK